jgi:hypothetical protein
LSESALFECGTLFPSLQIFTSIGIQCLDSKIYSLSFRVDLFCKKITFQDMKKILIVPDGGMLFESAGIADILMQANRLHPEGARKSATRSS